MPLSVGFGWNCLDGIVQIINLNNSVYNYFGRGWIMLDCILAASVSAKHQATTPLTGRFCFLSIDKPIILKIIDLLYTVALLRLAVIKTAAASSAVP